MSVRTRAIGLLTTPAAIGAVMAIVVAGLVAIPVVGLVSAGAPSVGVTTPGSASGSATSFGNVTNVTFQGHDYQGEYFGNATYGFVVNITETNVTANITEIQVDETYGVSIAVQYYRPNSSSPAEVTKFAYTASETDDAWANVTTAANVTEAYNGTTSVAPAVGLLNASTQTRETVQESVVDTLDPNATIVYSVTANASYQSSSSVRFAPALGLFPTGPIFPGERWASTAAFTASGAWTAAWALNVTTQRGSLVLNGTGGATVGPFSGNVTLLGFVGTRWGSLHSTAVGEIEYSLSSARLTLIGPFALGAAMPSGLGAGFGGAWSTYHVASASVALNTIYMNPDRGWATRVDSISASFSASFADPADGGGVSDNTSATTVIGEPMSAAQAKSTAVCLQSGTCTSSSPAGASSVLGSNGMTVLALVGATLAVAVVVGAIALTRRGGRSPPSPSRDNASTPMRPSGPAPTSPSPNEPSAPDEIPTVR